MPLPESSQGLAFSADVFYAILMFTGVKIHNLVWLWTSRNVSRQFKDAVERVFIMRHLKRTRLSIYGGAWYSVLAASYCTLLPTCSFILNGLFSRHGL